jgi:glycosyltransferase involved in cell wall biosynthesis
MLNPTPAIVLGKLFRKKVVVNYHSGEALEHLSSSRAAVRTLRQADAIVVQSPFLEDVFARSGLETTVIANHLDPGSLPFRTRRPLRPVFLSTRALEPSYDVATTLRAFRIIQHRLPDAELRIIGDGSERARLEQLTQELGLQAVTFSGIVDAADMAEVYDAADVLLNASTLDSMPLSILEAFASGLPVVSTDAGGIPWLVADGETGLLVPPGDPSELAAAALRLLDDEPLAVELVTAAYARCSAYSWTATREDWLALYGAPGAMRSDVERTPVAR